eukprot:SAG22_NODE_5819_length_947_cov_1.515330_2_plen_120_part_00
MIPCAQVAVGSDTWFTSAATAYTSGNKTLSTADSSLKLASATTGTGADETGAYKSTTLVGQRPGIPHPPPPRTTAAASRPGSLYNFRLFSCRPGLQASLSPPSRSILERSCSSSPSRKA